MTGGNFDLARMEKALYGPTTQLPNDLTPEQGRELILKAAKDASCKGCSFRELPDHGTKAYCTNPDRKSVVADLRCEDYEEEE